MLPAFNFPCGSRPIEAAPPLEGSPDHRVSEVRRTVENGYAAGQALPYAQVRGLPRNLFIQADQSCHHAANHFFMRLDG